MSGVFVDLAEDQIWPYLFQVLSYHATASEEESRELQVTVVKLNFSVRTSTPAGAKKHSFLGLMRYDLVLFGS